MAAAWVELTENIRRRAYGIWESEGRLPGREEYDWLRAESEIRGALKPVLDYDRGNDIGIQAQHYMEGLSRKAEEIAVIMDPTEHIRRRAYELWESEGRPDGLDQAHWLRAESEINGGVGTKRSTKIPPKPDGRPPHKTKPKAKVR